MEQLFFGQRDGPSLRELQAEVEEHLQPHAPPMCCRACGQRVQLYRRKLNSGMARALVRLYRLDRDTGGEWMDYRRVNARGQVSEISLLRFWGLVEPHPGQVGFWRITAEGRAFVQGKCEVPRAVWHFDNRAYGFTNEHTSIRRALGDKFDLDELLYGYGEPDPAPAPP